MGLCPGFADLQSRLGTLHRDADNFLGARVHYEAARAANPQFAPARVLLGVTLLSLGEADLAVAEWREVLTIDPDNRSAKMYLRMVEAQRNARASKAPPPPESASQLGPDAREEPLG